MQFKSTNKADSKLVSDQNLIPKDKTSESRLTESPTTLLNSSNKKHSSSTTGEERSSDTYSGSHNIKNLPITSSFPNTLSIHPKLKINKPGDKYEQEADQMANQIMRMETPTIQRKCAKCDGRTDSNQVKSFQF